MLPADRFRLRRADGREPRAIVAALAARGAATVGELCASLAEFPADALRRAMLDLARHDVVSIES